jgi:signal transduction histidine kinase
MDNPPADDIVVRDLALLMAHDLRNLFSVLTGMVVLMEHRQEPRYLEAMKRQLDLCDQIVTSFARYAQEGPRNPGQVLLRPLIDSVLDAIPPNPMIAREVHDTGPLSAIVDPVHVRQILLNLVGNAMDACGEGPGTIKIGIYPDAGKACLRIQDSGPGIPSQVEPILTQRNITTKVSGLGLGLLLTRKLVELNGGTLQYQSGPGACFIVSLPAGGS